MNRFRMLITASALITAIAVNLIAANHKPNILKESGHASVLEEPANTLKLSLHSKNYEGGQTYLQGQPFGIQVGLKDERFHGKAPLKEEDKVKQGIRGVTVGTKEWPWFRGLSIRLSRIEDSKGISRTVPVLEKLNWPKRMTSPHPGGHVENDVMYRSLISVFTIEPQLSQSLRPGRYIIQASWDSTGSLAQGINIWHGRLAAKDVEFVIVVAETKQDKGKLAFMKANDYSRKKDFDAALTEALKAEKLFPAYRQSLCYTIAARAYQAKGDIRSAIKYYKKFLEVHKNTNPNRWIYPEQVRHGVKALEASLNKATNEQERPKEKVNLTVSLSCFKEKVALADPNQKRPVLVPVKQAAFFDPLILKLIITNKSTKDIRVLWPEFPPRTLIPLFQRTDDNKLVPPQVKWLASLSQDYINIPAGKTYEVLLYLEKLFPFGIPPGTYDVRLKYTPGIPDYKTWVQTNSISLTIDPLSEEEQKELEKVSAILVGGFAYKPEAVKLFLAKYPDSRYRNYLRLQSFSSLMTLKEFDSASSMLDTIIADKKATTYQKSQAYLQKAYLLKKTGKLAEAIKCMEKAKLRHAYREAVKWKNDIKLLEQALKLNPAQKELHIHLGRAYELKGDIDNAIKEYRAYVKWVRSQNLPRTGACDLNDHADIIEQMVERLEQWRAKEKEKAKEEANNNSE